MSEASRKARRFNGVASTASLHARIPLLRHAGKRDHERLPK